GPNAQEPELASNVKGDPRWVFGPGPAITSPMRKPDAAAPATTLPAGQSGSPDAELDAIRALASPQEAADRLRKLLETLPAGETADLARLRLKDLDNVLKAAAQARLNPDVSAFTAAQPPAVSEDAARAMKGDKYAALRVADTLPPPASGELIERTDYGRWLIFSAYLGNGIAAYRLSEHFKNVDRRDTEASRYLNLARTNQYTPPRQLGAGR
ncbi:MAG: hypothetical protein JWQ11_3346, partial [Rhizobacter sp.]|nr:hypothetical protein [Rhizobacter sp.]